MIPLIATLNLACSRCQKLLYWWNGIYRHVAGDCDERDAAYRLVIRDDGMLQIQRYGLAPEPQNNADNSQQPA